MAFHLPALPEIPEELDYGLLDRLFDRTKTQVFLGKNASFMGSLLCSMNFSWVEDIPTACTDGVTLWWNPRFFLKLNKEARVTILLHELWHPALLHMVRRGDRHPKVWNWAADIVINNQLDDEGHTFDWFKPWMDHKYDGWTTEDVYDALMKEYGLAGTPDEFDCDIIEPDDPAERAIIEQTVVGNVVTATVTAQMSNGDVPGEVEIVLKRFLSPKLPWEQLLYRFFNELANNDYSWSRPNRRHSDIYLPGMIEDAGALDHIMYFQDVSGSISDGDSIRFNSEFKYVKETFKPKKMTFAQFDTRIQQVDVFEEDDPFDEIKIVGRGGTSLICVRDFIIEQKPTAVVIFSDLECPLMEPLPAGQEIPVIWVCLNNPKAKVNFGQLIHLRE